MTWVAIAIGVIVVAGSWGYWRNTARPLRRLTVFLRAQGTDFIRIRRGSASYGWPSYVVMFISAEKSSTFQHSSAFDALIQEVKRMHKNLVGFEAERAVDVDPIDRTRADVQH